MHTWRSVAFAVLAGLSHPAFSEPASLQEQGERRPVKIYAMPSYFRLTSDDKVLTGLGVGGGVAYALNSVVSIGAGLRQGYSSGIGGNSAVLFFATDINTEIALTGEVLRHRRSVLLDGREVTESNTGAPHGLRLTAGFTQYSMNTAFTAVPYSGVGAGLCYEWPLGGSFSLIPGIRMDRISNGRTVFFPLEVSLKGAYYL
jgi:hypothetical protein